MLIKKIVNSFISIMVFIKLIKLASEKKSVFANTYSYIRHPIFGIRIVTWCIHSNPSINYPICLNDKKRILHGQIKKIHFIDRFIVSARFISSDSNIFRTFIIHYNILYAADFNYLIRWVIVTYILLDISVVNSHATSAYKCELLAVTSHYLPSVRLDNADH